MNDLTECFERLKSIFENIADEMVKAINVISSLSTSKEEEAALRCSKNIKHRVDYGSSTRMYKADLKYARNRPYQRRIFD